MSLRVLHVLDHSLPLHSGYSFRTLAILREQRRLGYETFQLTSAKHTAGLATEESVEGWHFFRTPGSGAGVRHWPGVGEFELMRDLEGRLHAVIEQVRPQILHVHSPVLNALPSLWARRRTRIPVVYEMRASWEDAAVDHGTTREGSLRYRLSRAIESFALRRADQVTTICEGLRKDILARGGIAADKVTVIPNAVDVADFKFGTPADAALRARLGLQGATVIGFAGSFYRYEGLHLLLIAFADLAATQPALRLLLVGGGPEEANLRAQVAALKLDERVHFAGRVPHGEVQRYYELIDLLAYPRLPCRLTEIVTPLKPLQAMAQGRMFVASDVGGHRELIEHGQTGFLCPAGDVTALQAALADALAARETWPAMQQRARRHVERERTWAGSVARYAEVYRRALGQSESLAAVGG